VILLSASSEIKRKLCNFFLFCQKFNLTQEVRDKEGF
jgi:hypothetical protein